MASNIRNALKSSATKELYSDLLHESRVCEGASVLEFTFNKKRCRIRTEQVNEVRSQSKAILYWMVRDCRVQDNWAFLFAQKLALKNALPLHVCYFLSHLSKCPSRRQLMFLVGTLKSLSTELKSVRIPFHVVNSKDVVADLRSMCIENTVGCIVTDFHPMAEMQECIKNAIGALPSDVPLIEVDAHNVVPAWVASQKREMAARTIRPKIQKLLPEFLTGFPPLIRHPHESKAGWIMPTNALAIDRLDEKQLKNLWLTQLPHYRDDIDPIQSFQAHTSGAVDTLQDFITKRLKHYESDRNDPSKCAQSMLSPYLHFGNISAQRCALEVKQFNAEYGQSCASFLEELIVRKELADNYCLYTEKYDCLQAADKWAFDTLELHRTDKRPYTYSGKELEEAQTHEQSWNAAQLELVQMGKMHGYMRMYWCKKILEWTESPEQAIEIALNLNDWFSLDGSDPNGVVGVMWSICGVHDHGWKERPIFGKIRYMVEYSLKSKFNITDYCAKFHTATRVESKEVSTSKRARDVTPTSKLNKRTTKKKK